MIKRNSRHSWRDAAHLAGVLRIAAITRFRLGGRNDGSSGSDSIDSID